MFEQAQRDVWGQNQRRGQASRELWRWSVCGRTGYSSGAEKGVRAALPAAGCASGVGQREREEIKPSQQQETMNLAYFLMGLQPTSCDVLSDRCGESTGNVDETGFLTDSNNDQCCR